MLCKFDKYTLIILPLTMVCESLCCTLTVIQLIDSRLRTLAQYAAHSAIVVKQPRNLDASILFLKMLRLTTLNRFSTMCFFSVVNTIIIVVDFTPTFAESKAFGSFS